MAAALLHDVGKIEAGLGTYGRVMATLSAKAAGRDTARAWSQTRGITRRIGLYLLHEELGADLLRLAGSDPLTVDLVARWSAPTTPGRRGPQGRRRRLSSGAPRGEGAARRPMWSLARARVAAAVERALSAPTARSRWVSAGSASSSR